MKNFDLKKITLTIIVFLASLMVISIIIYSYQLKSQKLLGQLINLSGRQRMLSQKITKNCYRLNLVEGKDRSQVLSEIKSDQASLLESHNFLMRQGNQSPVLDSLLSSLKVKLDKIIMHSNNFIGSTDDNLTMAKLSEQEQLFLFQMDKTVLEYQNILESRQYGLNLSIYCFSVFIILLLLLVTFMVLIPALKKNEENKTNLLVRNEELENFVYIASHDLQEPLTTIIGFINLLKMEYFKKFDENGKIMLNHLYDSTLRMQGIIKSLLDYSRLQIEKQKETVDTNQLLAEVKEDLKILIEKEKATITYENLHAVNADKTDLRLLFQNLIINAIKYKKPDSDPIIRINSTESKQFVEFHVNDNGIGIEKKHFKRIFKMFQKLEQKEGSTSMGMGLAHCKKIVDNHGGTIRVEKNNKGGSSFIFTIRK